MWKSTKKHKPPQKNKAKREEGKGVLAPRSWGREDVETTKNITEVAYLYRTSTQNPPRASWTHVCHAYGLCTLQNTKNLLRKWCKKLFGTLPKRPHSLQNRLRTPSESKISVEHFSSSQKNQFFLAGPLMGEAINIRKSSPRAPRRTQKSILQSVCLLAQFFFRFSTSDERFSEDN